MMFMGGVGMTFELVSMGGNIVRVHGDGAGVEIGPAEGQF